MDFTIFRIDRISPGRGLTLKILIKDLIIGFLMFVALKKHTNKTMGKAKNNHLPILLIAHFSRLLFDKKFHISSNSEATSQFS
jgi:hypothetical protein